MRGIYLTLVVLIQIFHKVRQEQKLKKVDQTDFHLSILIFGFGKITHQMN